MTLFRSAKFDHLKNQMFCYLQLDTDFISHRGRASSYHLSCFWNLSSSPVHAAPIIFSICLFITEFSLLERSDRHLWEWKMGTTGEDQHHTLPLTRIIPICMKLHRARLFFYIVCLCISG